MILPDRGAGRAVSHGAFRRSAIFLGLLTFSNLTVAADATPARAGELSLAEAMARTLRDQPGVQIERQNVAAAEGALRLTRGQFDPALIGGFTNERRDTPLPPYRAPFSPLVERQTVASVGYLQAFRSGVVVNPQVSVVDASNSVTSPLRTATSEVDVAVTVPLLRGAGRASAGALERAAEISVAAQREASRFGIESRAFATINAYWIAAAARDSAQVVNDTFHRGEGLAKTVDALRQSGFIATEAAAQAFAQV